MSDETDKAMIALLEEIKDTQSQTLSLLIDVAKAYQDMTGNQVLPDAVSQSNSPSVGPTGGTGTKFPSAEDSEFKMTPGSGTRG